MARPLRLEHAGALWHITNRGVEQRTVYLDDTDRAAFLGLLASAVGRYRWRAHQYCLMTNHFHLLIETIEPTLSRGMQYFEESLPITSIDDTGEAGIFSKAVSMRSSWTARLTC